MTRCHGSASAVHATRRLRPARQRQGGPRVCAARGSSLSLLLAELCESERGRRHPERSDKRRGAGSPFERGRCRRSCHLQILHRTSFLREASISPDLPEEIIYDGTTANPRHLLQGMTQLVSSSRPNRIRFQLIRLVCRRTALEIVWKYDCLQLALCVAVAAVVSLCRFVVLPPGGYPCQQTRSRSRSRDVVK
jgi:hypothetical protein